MATVAGASMRAWLLRIRGRAGTTRAPYGSHQNAMPSPAATWLARNESFPLKVVRLLVVGAAPIAAALPALVDAAGT